MHTISLSPVRSRAALWVALLALVLGVVAVMALPHRAAAAGSTTYSATQTIPVPPASSYAGSGGGDGWAVAVGSTAVYNVFHHSSVLTVACHLQSDASACWTPETITDGSGNNFGTPGQPGMYLNQATGKLYVFATRMSDSTGGVVCIDTVLAATNPNPFCGFTALTAVGEAANDGMSAISAPALVNNKWYAFNYVAGAAVTGTENKLLCFDLSTFAACGSQPFALTFGAGNNTDGYFPVPEVAAIAGRVFVPVTVDAGEQLTCFNAATAANCAGTWPVALSNYNSGYGAAFPLLDATGATKGVCLPTGTDPCWDFTGASVSTPAGMSTALTASTGWDGPAFVLGPRVYLANGNGDQVGCYDASTSASCTNFPKALVNAGYLYTVNPDPQRPTCIWINADNGSAQIQNFDAYTGAGCGQGAIRVLAASFVVPTVLCQPTSYNSLQITSPARAAYTSGSVAFQDGDANPIPGLADSAIDATGSVDLTGKNLSTSVGLPQFLITLLGTSGAPAAVTVKLTWTGVDDPSCVGPGITGPSALALTPPTGSDPAGGTHTVVATAHVGGALASGQLVHFTITAGPNSGKTGSATTTAAGVASFSYADTGGAGTDTIGASFTDPGSVLVTAASVSETWTPVVVTGSADLLVTLHASAGVQRNRALEYLVSVKDLGPAAATSVHVVLTLPAGVTISDPKGGVVSGNTISYSAASVSKGKKVTFKADVINTLPSPGSLVATAVGSAAQTDPVLGNNTSSWTTTVLPS